MKSVLDGYLTESCKTCEFWRNTENEIGCGVPFPISHCKPFEEMCRDEGRKNQNENQ